MNKKLGKSEEIHYVKKQKVLAGSDAHLVWQHFTFGFPIALMTSNRDCHHSRVKTSQIILVLEFQGSSAQVLDENQDHGQMRQKWYPDDHRLTQIIKNTLREECQMSLICYE